MSNVHNRPSWDDYFFNVMDAASKRATCNRGKSGCVIVKDNHILVTGYVGAPKGLAHCDDVGHLIQKVVHIDNTTTEHCVRTSHAEQNAICQAAKLGIPLEGSILYCRMTPCRSCAQMIINCGIIEIKCERKYQLSRISEIMFRKADIKCSYKFKEEQKYD